MGHDNGRTRTVVRCGNCQSVYPAWEWPDGTVHIIGRETCACGSTDLREVEEAKTTSGDGESG